MVLKKQNQVLKFLTTKFFNMEDSIKKNWTLIIISCAEGIKTTRNMMESN